LVLAIVAHRVRTNTHLLQYLLGPPHSHATPVLMSSNSPAESCLGPRLKTFIPQWHKPLVTITFSEQCLCTNPPVIRMRPGITRHSKISYFACLGTEPNLFLMTVPYWDADFFQDGHSDRPKCWKGELGSCKQRARSSPERSPRAFRQVPAAGMVRKTPETGGRTTRKDQAAQLQNSTGQL
jgi:hypothetical protein